MPPRDPMTYPKGEGRHLDNMKAALDRSNRRPPIGVTQGGSSRDSRGAKVAATTAQSRPKKVPQNGS